MLAVFIAWVFQSSFLEYVNINSQLGDCIMVKKSFLIVLSLMAFYSSAWEAKVVKIMQHDTHVAIYLDPDPGKFGCTHGSPFLLEVNETNSSQQLFSMALAAYTTNSTLSGYTEPCIDALFAGETHPKFRRISLIKE